MSQPISSLRVQQPRAELTRARNAIARGQLTVGFLGGSITDMRPGHNWGEQVAAWLVDRFPDVRVAVENGAIGATDSRLAVFRAERDILAHDCDLVFVEYAVNDGGLATEVRNASREGLLRKLLAEPRDVVLAYTFGAGHHAEMVRGDVPGTIAEFEALAAHYRLPSVWMGAYALQEVHRGLLSWGQFVPDGVHPGPLGSRLYARSITDYLNAALVGDGPAEGTIPTGDARPAPLTTEHWEFAHRLPWAAVDTRGPWSRQRWNRLAWIDQALVTVSPGAGLGFTFEGRQAFIAVDWGPKVADFRVRVDGGDWQAHAWDRPAWCGGDGWFRLGPLCEALASGRHHLELETTINPEAAGSDFRVGLIGIVP